MYQTCFIKNENAPLLVLFIIQTYALILPDFKMLCFWPKWCRYAKGETIVGKGKGLRSVRLSFFKETPLQQPLALSAYFLDPARRARQDFSTGMTHKIVKSVILIACERVLPVSKDSRQQRKEQQGCAAPSQHQERMADDIKNTGNSPLKDITWWETFLTCLGKENM